MIHSRIRLRIAAPPIIAIVLSACAWAGPYDGTAAAAAPAKKAADGTLTNTAGMTLYTFDKDSAGKSACNGPCAANWPPLMAAAGAKPTGDWSVITREDGSKQWAYDGKPLYTWTKDRKPGDKTGDGFLNNTWHVAKD